MLNLGVGCIIGRGVHVHNFYTEEKLVLDDHTGILFFPTCHKPDVLLVFLKPCQRREDTQIILSISLEKILFELQGFLEMDPSPKSFDSRAG